MQFRNALLLLVSATVSTVLALPSAPGQCIGGQAAVGGSHLSASSLTTGSLATGGMTVSVNGQAVSEGGALTLPTGVEHTITLDVTGTNSAVTFFRGFLIRLGETDVPTLGVVQPVDTAISAVPGVCTNAGVGGVGHNSRVDKTTASAKVMLSSPAASMPLDVTAVVANRNGVSEYYYSSYTLSLETVTAAPVTAAPVAPVAPVAPTTPAPVTAAPTPMPTVADTPAPTPTSAAVWINAKAAVATTAVAAIAGLTMMW